MEGGPFVEWLRRQGYRVVRTESSYWFNRAARAFQAVPYQALIAPSAEEKRELFSGEKALVLRYSAPMEAEAGALSYHIICDTKQYDLKALKSKYRSEVRKGLSNCQVKQISLEQYAEEGWELESDTELRQGRPLSMTKDQWTRMITSAIGLPGFEAWGAHVENRLAASVFVFHSEEDASILYQQSLKEFFPLRINNALTYTVTGDLFSRPRVNSVFYGLQPLDASPGVDKFKIEMGYRARPVRQCVDFHPVVTRPVRSVLSTALELAIAAFPRKESLRRSRTLMQVSAEGRRPVSEQTMPDLLLPMRDQILTGKVVPVFTDADRTTGESLEVTKADTPVSKAV